MFSLERRQRLVRTSSNANGPLSLFQGATPSRRASLSLSITMQFVESAILGVRALRRRRRLRRRFGRRRLCGYEQSSHPKRISMRTYPPLGYPSNVSSPLYRLSRVCIGFFFCLKAKDAISSRFARAVARVGDWIGYVNEARRRRSKRDRRTITHNKLYWGDIGTNSIWVANLNGSDIQVRVIYLFIYFIEVVTCWCL